MRNKNILISAFACSPTSGSEGGVGWRWAVELARENHVVVLTDSSRRTAIELELELRPVANLKFVYFRPSLVSRLQLNSLTAHWIYMSWLLSLLPTARKLHDIHGFDLALHLTYGVFRHPSNLGLLGVPFVFGPVGGGEDAPFRFKRSLKPKAFLKELLRSLINKICWLDPLLHKCLASASLILTKTTETADALPGPHSSSAVIFSEIGVDVPDNPIVSKRPQGAPLRVLCAGRLIGWKGIHLAIHAVALCVRKGINVELTIVGDGSYEATLRALAENENISHVTKWIARLPQRELFALYSVSHCLVFPSFHDSSGNVVLEAQSVGLPVVCLDLGGPKLLVTDKSAFVIGASSLTVRQTVEAIALAIERLAKDETLRADMALAAINHARKMSWSNRIDEFGLLCTARLSTPRMEFGLRSPRGGV